MLVSELCVGANALVEFKETLILILIIGCTSHHDVSILFRKREIEIGEYYDVAVNGDGWCQFTDEASLIAFVHLESGTNLLQGIFG